MILTVKDVEYLGDYTLLCEFSDSVHKKVEMSPLLDKLMFEGLSDKSRFVQFGLDGTLFWSSGADIAPEYLYDRGIAVV